MQRRRLIAIGAVVASGTLVLAGCGSDDAETGGNAAPPSISAAETLGDNEGELRVLAWPGYAEDGTQYPKTDWVTPFEEESGCDVKVTTFNTSDESYQQMQTGEYDVVSASGDASRRLIFGGEVQPVNLDLITTYDQIFDDLKDKPWNTVDGVHYGVPHGRGANLLMYNTKVVKPAPTSWAETWNPDSPYKDKVTAYDNAIFIADAALYLKATQPDLGIENPYALDEKQLEAAKNLLIEQSDIIGEYWNDAFKSIDAFVSGNIVLGTTWQYNANFAAGEGAPVEAILPDEGSTGWSDTWMIASDTPNVNCSYAWLNYITSPGPNAEVAEWFGEAPANRESCDLTSDEDHCEIYHAGDAAYWENVYYWETPTADCADGRTEVQCTDYADWKTVWDEVRS